MQPIDDLKRITVFYHGREVGSIARTAEGLSPFEYCTRWLADGFSLNPLILPLKRGVFMPKLDPLHGMFGVFDDSLPDGWGRLLVDRTLQAHGKDPASVDGLARLALVGHSGMGALCYEPAWETEGAASPNTDFDHLAKECTAILAHKPS
ncbi:MAG: HipA N-terminal domain-containing protein, partial [Coriobacteriaceae bacterium]|nr:HipA N-terminal domain-containing protein [Coriobacteriaceae bacterium]